jgi:hypothetical protein
VCVCVCVCVRACASQSPPRAFAQARRPPRRRRAGAHRLAQVVGVARPRRRRAQRRAADRVLDLCAVDHHDKPHGCAGVLGRVSGRVGARGLAWCFGPRGRGAGVSRAGGRGPRSPKAPMAPGRSLMSTGVKALPLLGNCAAGGRRRGGAGAVRGRQDRPARGARRAGPGRPPSGLAGPQAPRARGRRLRGPPTWCFCTSRCMVRSPVTRWRCGTHAPTCRWDESVDTLSPGLRAAGGGGGDARGVGLESRRPSRTLGGPRAGRPNRRPPCARAAPGEPSLALDVCGRGRAAQVRVGACGCGSIPRISKSVPCG